MRDVSSLARRIVESGVLTAEDLSELLRYPEFRAHISRAIGRRMPLAVGVPQPDGRFVRIAVAPREEFDRRSFRTISVGSGPEGERTRIIVGCPRGRWDPRAPAGRQCLVGMRMQAVLVPMSRIEGAVRYFAEKAPAVRRVAANIEKPAAYRPGRGRGTMRVSQNPLLMTVENPVRAAIPGGAVSASPFPVGRKIPVGQFERWLRRHGTREDIAEFERARQAYIRWHGVEPEHVTRDVIDGGVMRNALTDRIYAYDAGASTHETYLPEGRSRKAGTLWVHKWKDRPRVLITPDGRQIIKPLRGRARARGWLYG